MHEDVQIDDTIQHIQTNRLGRAENKTDGRPDGGRDSQDPERWPQLFEHSWVEHPDNSSFINDPYHSVRASSTFRRCRLDGFARGPDSTSAMA